jgi:hypothetical protein
MPYIEQDAIYKRWNLTKVYFNQPESARTSMVKTYFCPTRRTPPELSVPGGDCDLHNGTFFPGALTDYACSSGDRVSYGGWLDDPSGNGVMVEATAIMSGGTILRWRSHTKFASISDGLSNTFLLGEKHVRKDKWGKCPCDAAAYNGSNAPRSYARCGGPGFAIATSPSYAIDDERIFGSYHPTVCQFVLGDGSVQPISNRLNTTILRRLVVRNDGEVVPSWDEQQ